MGNENTGHGTYETKYCEIKQATQSTHYVCLWWRKTKEAPREIAQNTGSWKDSVHISGQYLWWNFQTVKQIIDGMIKLIVINMSYL